MEHDSIRAIELRLIQLPLPRPISDAKVLTGRQRPLTHVAVLVADIRTEEGLHGFGFSYSKRAGGDGLFAHAVEIAPQLLGEDPNDIARLWNQLVWAGASVGRSGLATQAIAAFDVALWDLKAKRGGLSLGKLLGTHRTEVPCYNTSGGFLSSPLPEVLEGVGELVERGIGGIKLKVGHPDGRIDLERVAAVRDLVGPDFPLMVDANQQWDRPTALRMGRELDPLHLVWIEEPLDAYDVDGHAALSQRLDTPVATGEMLTSVNEHRALIDRRAADVLQPDAPRVGGVTPFQQITTLANLEHLSVAPHFAMELHVHLAASYPGPVWVEHFDWLEPLFNERLELSDGCLRLPGAPGLGLSLHDRTQDWTSGHHTTDGTTAG